jgi:hypothetical protein
MRAEGVAPLLVEVSTVAATLPSQATSKYRVKE